MFVTAVFAILVILSLKESSQKANLSKDNLAKNQANVDQIENKAEAKRKFFSETQSDLYKEKIQRNELLQQEDGEITLQIAVNNLDPNVKKKMLT